MRIIALIFALSLVGCGHIRPDAEPADLGITPVVNNESRLQRLESDVNALLRDLNRRAAQTTIDTAKAPLRQDNERLRAELNELRNNTALQSDLQAIRQSIERLYIILSFALDGEIEKAGNAMDAYRKLK